MKKVISLVLVFAMAMTLAGCGILGLESAMSGVTDTVGAEKGRVIFEYDNTRISEELSDEDFDTIKELFDNKKLYKDNPSCGFSEKIAVELDGAQTFCIARDECPVIYCKNQGLFFKLSDQENALLRSILTQYGFYSPCV